MGSQCGFLSKRHLFTIDYSPFTNFGYQRQYFMGTSSQSFHRLVLWAAFQPRVEYVLRKKMQRKYLW